MSPRLHLLGPPRLEQADQSHLLPLDRPASLGYYLLLRNDWVRRSELAYLYSPQADETLAFANLRKLVYRLKQQGWAAALEAEPTRLRLLLPTDVQVFRAALEHQDWTEALRLYNGPLLQGLAFPELSGYEAWLELERQDLARSWRWAVLEQVRSLEAQGDWATAQRWLEQLLRQQPLEEDAVQALMRVLQASGHGGQALETFERFRQHLKAELDLEPLESTRALADSLRNAPTATTPNQLPTPSSRFIGRRRELTALLRQLNNPDCRLLSIVGLGGMGKTRLALEAAHQLSPSMANGAGWVALAGLSQPQQLVSSIAGAIGLNFSGPLDPQTQLTNYLRPKEILLVLDNFEHLLEAGLLLEELLQAAPKLKLLVTSRSALELSSEWLFDLEGLPYPPPNTPQDLDGFDAVRLFISRAERLWQHFVLTPTTLEAIAELCRRVEGMPLALELAATWVRGISVSELLEQLSQSLATLQSHHSDWPERHRNLQAILEYTWQQLSPLEQHTLARLSVFRGGFTLEAAQSIAEAQLGLLMRLINQALLRRSESGRYDMHELVRQFAAQKLQELSLTPPPQNPHAHFFAQLGQRLGPQVMQTGQPQSLQQLSHELPNLQAAWAYAFEQPLAEVWPGVALALSAVWEVQGRYPEAQAAFEQASWQSWLPTADLGWAQQQNGHFLRRLGRLQEALAALQQSLEGLPPPKRTPALLDLAQVHMALGDYPNAASDLQQAQTLLENWPTPAWQGELWQALGDLAKRQGQPLEAKALYQRHLDLAQQQGLVRAQVEALGALADIEGHLGHFDQALSWLRQSQPFWQNLGDRHRLAESWLTMGNVLYDQGHYDQAEQAYQEALALYRQTGNRLRVSAALNNLGGVAFARGNLNAMKQYIQESLAVRRELGDKAGIARGLSNLAMVAHEQKDYPEAIQLHLQSLEIKRELSDQEGMATAYKGLGLAAYDMADYPAALTYFRRSVHTAWQANAPVRTLDALEGLAGWLQGQGHWQQAALYLGLIKQHPACSHWVVQLVEERLQQLRPQVPESTLNQWLEQGAQLDLGQTIQQIPPH